MTFLLLFPGSALAIDLVVSDPVVEPCPADDSAAQSDLKRPVGASCYALRGLVSNPGKRPVVDTDVFAQIIDGSGEPALANRTRVGSIGDVPPGDSPFALRLSIPAGTPGPFGVRKARARGFNAPVRTRAGAEDELLPLEQDLSS
jgi:hypothetical protein